MVSEGGPFCFDSRRVFDGCLAIDKIAFILLIKAILAKFGWCFRQARWMLCGAALQMHT